MKNLDVSMIKKGLKDFTYTPPKSNWDKYLDNNSDYNPDELVEVRAKITYTDVYLGKKIRVHETVKMPKWRASVLEATTIRSGLKGLVERV